MPSEDHDQRFKTILRENFAEFLTLFFSKWTSAFDLGSIEWLEQEVFSDPPDGPRRTLDLVAKINLTRPVDGHDGPMLAVVHVEVESGESAAKMRRRMYRYNVALRGKLDLPVLPIVVYLKVGLGGIDVDAYVERFDEFEVARFQFIYVGLPALDGLQYVEGPSYLGVALSALMKVPRERVAWLGAEALRRLTEAPITERQRFLLAECVQAYLPMNEEQRSEFNQLLEAKSYGGVKAMNKTVYEQGVEKGLAQGREQGIAQGLNLGQVKAARTFLENKFGPMPSKAVNRLESLPADQLDPLMSRIVSAQSLHELGLLDE